MAYGGKMKSFTIQFDREVDEIEKNYLHCCSQHGVCPDNPKAFMRYMFAALNIAYKEIRELQLKDLQRTKNRDNE